MPRRQKSSPPKKKMTKRRLLRVIYRRGRVYVPVLALLLLVMAFLLPISPPGLAGYIGRTIESRTGLPVSIGGVRLRLVTGEVSLSDVVLRDVEGGEPFEIGEIFLTGDFGELIAGEGRWPAQIVIDNPSELRFRQQGGRLEPRGPLATLIRWIESARIESPDDDEDEEPLEALERPTPAITIRNVHAVLRSDDPRLAGTRVALQSIQVPQRIGSGEPFKLNFNGIATAGLSEDFSGTLVYSPPDNRVAAEVRLDGIKRDVTIRGFGDVHLAARGITMSATAQQLAEGAWQLSLDQDFQHFEISEMRTGGERWVEQDLSVRARGVWEQSPGLIRETTLSIGGEEIDLSMSGAMGLENDLDGDARLQVRRFPAPLIALGERLARDEGFNVSRQDEARLLVDVAIDGPFARIGEMNIDGTVDVAGWSFQRTGWPEAVTVHDARGVITNSTLALSNLQLSSGTLEASGSLRVPVTIPEDETREGSIELSLSGTPETAFDFLRTHGITQTVVSAATVPLSINVSSSFEMERHEGLLAPMLKADTLRVGGNVSWDEGTLLLDVIPGIINVQSGGLTFDDTHVVLNGLRASLEETKLSVSGRLELDAPHDFSRPSYLADLNVSGAVDRILGLAETHIELPPELATVKGDIELVGNLRGVLAKGEWPLYDMTVRIANGEGIATFQVNPVHFTQVNAEINATNDRIEVRRLDTRLQDDTHARVTAEVTRESAQSTVAIETSLETVNYVLPRDLDEMVMEGKANAEGSVWLEVNRPLPEAPDVVTAWMQALADPETYRIRVQEGSPLRLRIDTELTPQEPVTLFHREFPHRVDNIRGIVRADELGFIMESVASRWGDADNVIVSGRVTLGHVGPVNISFDLTAPELDLNEWIDGWGDREWAEVPRLGADERQARRDRAAALTPDTPRAPRLRTTINGRLRLGRTEFLTVRSQDMVGELHYEAWEGADNKLQVNVEESRTYDGSLKANAVILFPSNQKPRIRASIDAVDVGVNGFMADLRRNEEQTVGKFTGKATLEGLLVDYSTWTGAGEYVITDSKFIGDQVLILLSRTFRFGFEQTQADTRWEGTGTFRDEFVYLPDIKISNNEFNLVADGAVGFDGSLDFRVGVEFLGNRIEWIPLVGRFAPMVNRFTDFLLSAKLEGTVHDPRVRMVPLSFDGGIAGPRSYSGGNR